MLPVDLRTVEDLFQHLRLGPRYVASWLLSFMHRLSACVFGRVSTWGQGSWLPKSPKYIPTSSRRSSTPRNKTRYDRSLLVSIVAYSASPQIHIFRTLNNTARVYKNKVSSEVVRLERRPGGAKFEELRELVSGQRGRLVYENGDPDYGIWRYVVSSSLRYTGCVC